MFKIGTCVDFFSPLCNCSFSCIAFRHRANIALDVAAIKKALSDGSVDLAKDLYVDVSDEYRERERFNVQGTETINSLVLAIVIYREKTRIFTTKTESSKCGRSELSDA
jgi:hypothetical protein